MTRSNRAKRHVWSVEGQKRTRVRDALAVEEPLEIQLQAGGEERTIAITMRTPGNDYELAAGFLHSEGIVQNKQDILRMIYCVDGRLEKQEYNLLRIFLNSKKLPDLHQLDRYFFTNSACGVCGRTMLDELEERSLPPVQTGQSIQSDVVTSLPIALRRAQKLFDSTGGLHAAALFDLQGNLLAAREDVGRHNALDKLIGWGLLNQELPYQDKVILVSGRASYELLQKCRVVAAPILCAVSAPSSLAVDLADRFGITLVGFLRDERFNIYTYPERINVNALAGVVTDQAP